MNTGRVADLRSDTLTTPTPEMRRAMAEAEVGDDVFGEDPTVNRLQERVAQMFEMEAALFVPTGSMGNLVSLRALTQPGDEILCHEQAHVIHYEVAALSAVAGVQARTLPGEGGVLDPERVSLSVKPQGYTYPRTRVVAVENTHNLAGGAIYPLDDLRALRKVALDHGLAVYMDGARVFNASIASGVPVSEYAAEVDAISFCFSKGLGCPVGSVVVGTRELITKAHRYRKMHGGGMRQAGVLAAPCLVALDSMVERLAEDHVNARTLAEGIAAVRPDAVDLAQVQTNMVIVNTSSFGLTPQQFSEVLSGKGVKCLPYQPGKVRMVTHKDVSSADIDFAIDQIRSLT